MKEERRSFSTPSLQEMPAVEIVEWKKYLKTGGVGKYSQSAAVDFVSHFLNGALKYVVINTKSGHWNVWNGRYWIREANNHALRAISELIQDYVILLGDINPSKAESLRRPSTYDAILKELKGHPDFFTTIDEWDAAEDKILLENGSVVDTDTEGFSPPRPGKPEELLSIRIQTMPDASGKRPKLWEEFMVRAYPNEDVRKWIKRYFGSFLLSGNPDQAFVVFLGTAQNGKSTMFSTIGQVLGHGLTSNLPSQVMVKSPVARHMTEMSSSLENRRLIVMAECDAHLPINAELVKTLTGEQYIDTRKIGTDMFRLKIQFKFVGVSNHIPLFSEFGEAMTRRCIFVPMQNRIPDHKLNTNFPQLLMAEREQICAWMFEGLKDYLESDGIRPLPVVIQQQTTKICMLIAPIENWLRTEIVRLYPEDASLAEQEQMLADQLAGSGAQAINTIDAFNKFKVWSLAKALGSSLSGNVFTDRKVFEKQFRKVMEMATFPVAILEGIPKPISDDGMGTPHRVREEKFLLIYGYTWKSKEQNDA